jgi:NTE family protein
MNSTFDVKTANNDLAFVLTGGGARGAYQVGVLRWLARNYPDLRVPIITGVSAGAVNAALLAGHPGTFPQAVAEATALWGTLTADHVFRVDASSLMWNMLRWGARLLSGTLGGASRTRGFLDTAPLRKYLEEVYASPDGTIPGIDYNLQRGVLKAVAISTTNYSTGQSIIWVQGKDIRGWTRPQRIGMHTRITVDHVMASAALPLFFPAVQIGKDWYGDGGVRQSAPLSPALHLGARRIIAISTRFDQSPTAASRRTTLGYPPPAQVFGMLMNAVFLDLIDQDTVRLQRANRLIAKLPHDQREGIRIIDFVTLRPSRDLGRLARKYEPRLPLAFRFLTRGLGTRESASPDLLSMLLFQPDYLNKLMDVGEADAERQAEKLATLIDPERCQPR